jgi:hypothetical protein
VRFFAGRADVSEVDALARAGDANGGILPFIRPGSNGEVLT